MDFFTDLVEDAFDRTKVSYHEAHGKGHGREGDHYRSTYSAPDDLPDVQRWAHLKAIGTTRRGDKEMSDVRLCIVSRCMAETLCRSGSGGGHWGGNSWDWQLDVMFGADQPGICKGQADSNLSIVRRMALSLLRNDAIAMVGVKGKRFTTGWDDDYLENILFR